MDSRTCGALPYRLRAHVALQLQKVRVHSTPVLCDHCRGFPDCPDPKVRYFSVKLDALANPCTNRAYAITRKKKWVAGILYTIIAVQFCVGIYMLFWAALKPCKYFRPITHARALELRKGCSTEGTYGSSARVSHVYSKHQTSLHPSSDDPLCCLWYVFRHSSYSPILRTYPSARSLRHRNFRSCSRTNPSHQIDVPRGERAENPRYSQQGRGDILRCYYHDTFLDSGYVCWGKGGFYPNSIRV